MVNKLNRSYGIYIDSIVQIKSEFWVESKLTRVCGIKAELKAESCVESRLRSCGRN